MKIPTIHGIIDRRILINYRVDPDILAKILPQPFQPKLVNDYGIAGICLIRLKNIRPKLFPPQLGLTSENAAYRIAVKWAEGGHDYEGVFIPRRDTSSRLNSIVGGRLFPGYHHLARFQVLEWKDRFDIRINSNDGVTHLRLEARQTANLPSQSIFHSLYQASKFFQAGSIGYSVTPERNKYDGLELRVNDWEVKPLVVDCLESSFFENRDLFPTESIRFDCALIMQDLQHEWHSYKPLYCDD